MIVVVDSVADHHSAEDDAVFQEDEVEDDDEVEVGKKIRFI